jgi:rubrerythrin
MPTVQIVRFRPGPFDWRPPSLWKCPVCNTAITTREAEVRCPTCGHYDSAD